MVNDSIEAVQVRTVQPDTLHTRTSKPLTPYQVLRTLPRDATPAQQDSAIQAAFKPQQIRYSERPDTLHLPGHGPGTKLTDVELPIYYEKTFFADNGLLHTTTTSARYGVPGDPVPYTLHGDNIITLLLLACFMLSVVSFANSRRFFIQQLKGLFHVPRMDDTFMPETSNELRFQLFLVAQTCLLLAILQYSYTQEFIGTTFVLPSDYHLIGLFALLFVGYFVLKAALYTVVNTVFFDVKRNVHWLKTLLFITSVEGVVLFPIVLLLVYFDMEIEKVMTYLIIVLILVKILTFYKCFIIFFRRLSVYLQIFLYFCTLEIVPLTLFWGILILTGKLLKVNY
ncbi:MAG: DUF4271 domain-containing protein [Prevotella sp.]|nr:DUF4271 domain-containing protein [Prevotella sp.]